MAFFLSVYIYENLDLQIWGPFFFQYKLYHAIKILKQNFLTKSLKYMVASHLNFKIKIKKGGGNIFSIQNLLTKFDLHLWGRALYRISVVLRRIFWFSNVLCCNYGNVCRNSTEKKSLANQIPNKIISAVISTVTASDFPFPQCVT